MDDIDFEQDFGKSATVGPKTSGEGYSKKKKKGSYVTTPKCYQCVKKFFVYLDSTWSSILSIEYFW